ncbi:MAG TPA: hypothetical protein VMS77_01910 [Conexivisphaerales archaeon]|nr:hypothetical protein [Conexivisphaerales archaeon]
MPAPVGALNNSVLAALLFIYIFVIQYLPMSYATRLAAQLFVGVAGVMLGFYLARLGWKESAALFAPVAISWALLVYTGLDSQYLYFASFGLLVILVFAVTWKMKR